MYRTSVLGLVETSGSAEGVKDSILSFSGSGIWWGRKLGVLLGLAAAYSLEVIGTTAVGTSLTICGSVILSCFSARIFAMASFSAVRACFIFVVNFVVLEVLLFAMAILTAGGISSLSFQEPPS